MTVMILLCLLLAGLARASDARMNHVLMNEASMAVAASVDAIDRIRPRRGTSLRVGRVALGGFSLITPGLRLQVVMAGLAGRFRSLACPPGRSVRQSLHSV